MLYFAELPPHITDWRPDKVACCSIYLFGHDDTFKIEVCSNFRESTLIKSDFLAYLETNKKITLKQRTFSEVGANFNFEGIIMTKKINAT